jgi:hypothetical protein
VKAKIYYLNGKIKITQASGKASFGKYKQFLEYHIFPFTWSHLVIKILSYIEMLFIFSTPVLIRHLWQLQTVGIIPRCLLRAVPLNFNDYFFSQIYLSLLH